MSFSSAGFREATSFSNSSAGRTRQARVPQAPTAKAAPAVEGNQKLERALEVSVDFHGDDAERIAAALNDASAKLSGRNKTKLSTILH
jgi:hypothetical protein